MAWNWACTLARQDHEVWVLTGDPDGSEGLARRLAGSANLHFVVVPTPNRFLSSRGQFGVYRSYLSWQRAAYQRARELDYHQSMDVVHHISWGSLIWGSPLWRLGLPFVFGPVGGGQVTPRGYGRYFGAQWGKELLRSWVVKRILPINPLTRRTVRQAWMVLASNTDTLGAVQHIGARESHLVIDTAPPPSYAESASTRTLARGETIRIVWVARLYPIKGLRLALEALAQVRDLPWRLTIVGGGPLAGSVPGWLKELKIEDRVQWVGQISWDDVRKAYLAAHVMLFSSLRDSGGNQLYEALGCGLPVIALNHQGARDMLPDNAAIKVAVGSPTETVRNLSNAVRHLADNPTILQDMSIAASEFSAINTWETKVRDTYALIERSLEIG